jgi:hypothetical protein
MVHCAKAKKAGLVIVSRDSDYGVTLEGKSYINDHLRQEFSERVSRKRSLLLYPKLSDALKLFKVEVSRQEEEAEADLVTNALNSRHDPGSVMNYLYGPDQAFRISPTIRLSSLLQAPTLPPITDDLDGIGSRQVPEFGSFLGRLAKGMRSKKDDADTEIG